MRAALLVFRKEVREMFRDKRVINGAFVMPVFLIVLMMLLFGFLGESLRKPKAPRVLVVDSAIAREHTPRLFPKAEVTYVPSLADGETLLLDGQARILLEFDPDFDASLLDGGAKLTAVYDPDETLSQIALNQIAQGIAKENAEKLTKTMAEAGVPASKLEAIRLESKTPESKKREGPNTLVQLLPYLIVIWAFYGGFSTVADMVAGEKERGTMETLLISPAHRTQIVLGKFLALSLVCLISSLMSFVGLVLVRVLDLPITRSLIQDLHVLDFSTILSIFIVLVPLVLFFAGMLLAVSALARNMREAQTYLTLVSFVVLMPAMFSQFIGFTDFGKENWVKFTPILNTAMSIRNSLQERVDWAAVGVTVLVSLVLAVVLLRLVVVLFSREEILTRV